MKKILSKIFENNCFEEKEIKFNGWDSKIYLVLCQYFGHKKSNFFMLHF